ncbi:MAG: hypothetical protein ACYT04_75865, partial [Nostoc sp.]
LIFQLAGYTLVYSIDFTGIMVDLLLFARSLVLIQNLQVRALLVIVLLEHPPRTFKVCHTITTLPLFS